MSNIIQIDSKKELLEYILTTDNSTEIWTLPVTAVHTDKINKKLMFLIQDTNNDTNVLISIPIGKLSLIDLSLP